MISMLHDLLRWYGISGVKVAIIRAAMVENKPSLNVQKSVVLKQAVQF